MEYEGGHPFYGDAIGILMLDMTAPLIPGNVGNARSYDFPVRFKILEGVPSNWFCDEAGPNEKRGDVFVKAAKELEAEGCKAITAGCGFFAIYQKRTADAVKIPVFTSPLLMVPMISKMLGGNRKVGIISAVGRSLEDNKDFLANVGIDSSTPYVIGGMEKAEEFYNVHVVENKKTVNPDKMQAEIVEVALELQKNNPDLGAFVFECSDLPPFARAVTQATGIPVFDYISLAHLVYRSVEPVQYPPFYAKTR